MPDIGQRFQSILQSQEALGDEIDNFMDAAADLIAEIGQKPIGSHTEAERNFVLSMSRMLTTAMTCGADSLV